MSNLLTTLNCKLFSQKSTILDVSQVLSSSLSTINQMFLTNNKRAISRFFGMVALTTSSNKNVVIRPVLNFLFFFYDKISQVQKSTKRIQGTKKHQKALKSIKTQPI